MKNLVIASLAGIASTLGVINPVLSQNEINREIAGIKVMTEPVMPQRLGYVSIDPKAMRDFKKNFANVNNEIWAKNRNGYMALFTSDGIRFKVEYDDKGNRSATQKSYSEEKLQPDIRAAIKRVYFNYTINWITELTVPDEFTGTAYIIQIQDDRNCKRICLYEGEMKTLESFQKPGR